MDTTVGVLSVLWGIVVFVVAYRVSQWITRCRHTNPHYVRPIHRRDPSGMLVEIEPARYTCFDCGKTWRAELRDPAWAATGVKQIFEGHDEGAAARAATRAVIVEAQRTFLAANRAAPTRSTAAPGRHARARRRRPANVTDIHSRRPA
jgi:transposase-like protein